MLLSIDKALFNKTIKKPIKIGRRLLESSYKFKKSNKYKIHQLCRVNRPISDNAGPIILWQLKPKKSLVIRIRKTLIEKKNLRNTEICEKFSFDDAER